VRDGDKQYKRLRQGRRGDPSVLDATGLSAPGIADRREIERQPVTGSMLISTSADRASSSGTPARHDGDRIRAELVAA